MSTLLLPDSPQSLGLFRWARAACIGEYVPFHLGLVIVPWKLIGQFPNVTSMFESCVCSLCSVFSSLYLLQICSCMNSLEVLRKLLELMTVLVSEGICQEAHE